MRHAVVALSLVACGESTAPPSSSASTDAAAEDARYECCVDGKDCRSGEPIRWCASRDSGCKLSTLVGCYMRVGDAGVIEAYSTSHLAPEDLRPTGIVECNDEGRSKCGR